MTLRDDSQSLNPEEFLTAPDDSRDSEESGKLMEIIRVVKGSQEEDVLGENAGISSPPSGLGRRPADEQWDDPASAEKQPDAKEDGATDPENEEPDWEPEAETLEVLDDPVRM